MNHAVVMGQLESPAQLDRDFGHLAPREPSTRENLFFQARAGDQLHGIEQRPGLFTVAVEPHNIRMAQLFERLDLGLEPQSKTVVAGQRGREDLDGRRLARFGIHRRINGAHAAFAQHFSEAIRAQLFLWHGDGTVCE